MQNNENAFNYALGEVMQNLRAGWKNRVKTEMNDSIVYDDGRSGRADNLIYPDDMQPVVIEAAFGNTPNIDGDAIARLGAKESGNNHDIMTAVAVKIPLEARTISNGTAGMREWLEGGAKLEYAVYSAVPAAQGETRAKPYDIRYPDGDPDSGWIYGTARDLADLIELAATPDMKIKQIAQQTGGAVRGIGAQMYSDLPKKIRADIAQQVGQPADEHAMRVAACVWLNALSLHSKLAAARPGEVLSHDQCKTVGQTAQAWRDILKIDYHSVFYPALASLELLPPKPAANILARLCEQVDAINSLQLGGVADVSSDMFPELATDRKVTAAYYTKMEVAELLAGLAFNLIGDNGNQLKIADFACGTGALLKAAYRQVRRRADFNGEDLNALHKTYMEECLHGADIQPIATHLTVAGLAGMRPQADYEQSNVICADIRNGKTGALDLLEVDALRDLFGGEAAAGVEGKYDFRPADGSFDLCIMNPPYSRPHGGKMIFGAKGVPESQRKNSVKNLGLLLADSFANMRAGMASAFCYLADKKLKHGGVLAAVLPLSAAGQDSWREFRKHIVGNYSDIMLIGTATQELQSFSADTGMGEMLIVARKSQDGGNGKITTANLHRLPRDFVEAHEVARALRHTEQSAELKIGDYTFATCVKLPSKNGDSWGDVGVASHEMAIVAAKITQGILVEPGLVNEFAIKIPMAYLSAHCEIGPSHDEIGHPPGGDGRGAFALREFRRGDRVNLSLWEANHETQVRLVCAPTHHGKLMDGQQASAKRMLDKQSTLFISRGLGLASQKIAAAMTEAPCMGGRAWNALQCPQESRAAYCLWFNSLPGLICRWQCSGRQHPGRAQMQLVNLKNFPAPDFNGKTAAAKRAVKIANEEFPRLAEMTLMPCSYAWRDNARKEIDRVVLNMLGIKATEEQMQALRETWCREPSVHGGNKTIIKTLHDDKLL